MNIMSAVDILGVFKIGGFKACVSLKKLLVVLNLEELSMP